MVKVGIYNLNGRSMTNASRQIVSLGPLIIARAGYNRIHTCTHVHDHGNSLLKTPYTRTYGSGHCYFRFIKVFNRHFYEAYTRLGKQNNYILVHAFGKAVASRCICLNVWVINSPSHVQELARRGL
jgi:hypothetical protein